MSGKAGPKGRDFLSYSAKITLTREKKRRKIKEEEQRRRRKNCCTLSIYIGFFGDGF